MYVLQSGYVQDYFESTYHQVAMPKLSMMSTSKTIIPIPPLAEQQRIVAKIEQVFAEIDAIEKNKELLKTHIKQTRQKILDLAIHGKLVPQDKNDEPASVLLEKILQEKAQSDNKKSPKKKKTNDIATSDNRPYKKNGSLSAEDAPFDIPNSWEWVKLPDICLIPITDGTHQTPTYSTKEMGIPFLSSKDVAQQKIVWDNIKYITKELHQELYKRIAPQKNDILLAKNGTTGVAALVETDDIFDIYVTLAVIRPSQSVYPKYLLWAINSPFTKKQFDDSIKGTGVPNLHLIEINKTLIPLPPLAEQKRIASKIESLFSILDAMEEECD